MKKALVVLLLLAFAGSGLFAQTVTWNGNFEGGVGMVKYDDADDPVWGGVAPTSWVDGARAQLQVSYANANANAGFRARFRVSSAGGGWTAADLFLHQAWGWIKFNDMVEMRGGRIHDDKLGSADPILGPYLFNSTGLLAYITPTDMFTIGLGAFSGTSLINGVRFQDGTYAAGVNIWAGLGVALPGLMHVRAQASIAGDQIHAQASAQITALDIVPIDVVFRFRDLQDFSDVGRIDGNLFVGLKLIDNLGINLGAAFSTSQNDAHDDLFMGFGGWLTFAIGNIVPRLDAWFISGGSYIYSYGLNATGSNLDYPAATYDSDQTYLSLRPSVQFRVTSTAWFDLGAIFNVDMGSGNAAGSSDKGVSFGLYTAVRASF